MAISIVRRPKPLPVRKIKHYGWNPDLPDIRDHMYAAPADVLTHLPPRVDLRAQCPAVYDQGQLGSSVVNAIAGAIEYCRMKERLTPNFIPSRLFMYYNGRVVGGMGDSDSGTQIRDGIKVVATEGVPPETDWPYDIAKFAQKPPPAAYTDALHDRAVQYQRIVRNIDQMKGCLASGYPFVFGFTIYESFESQTVAQTGVVPWPARGETVVGGHAVMAVGYDDSQQRFIVRNSWGATWGMQGYFTIAYAYLMESNLSADFWTVRLSNR